jgi:AAA family ATP:ADP antiporter
VATHAQSPEVARAVTWATLGSGAMIAQQVAGKAVRDALFLGSFDASNLPRISAVASLLGLVAVVAVTRLFARLAPARVVPAMFLVGSTLWLAEWALSLSMPRFAAASVYLHTALFGAITISSFWSVVNERFEPRTAREVIGRIGMGGTFGGVVGGLVAWQAARFVSAASLLVLLAAFGLVASLASFQIGSSAPRGDTLARGAGEDADLRPLRTGLALLGRAPYLQSLALLITLAAVASSLLDYLLGAGAAASYASGEALLSFFALFHMGVSLASFVVQSVSSRWVLDRLGLAGTVALAPAAPLLSGAAMLLIPGPIGLVLLRAPEAVLRNSLFRSGYELFYTPLPKDDKRSTKTLIDVGFDRVGTAVGGGLAVLLLALPLEKPGVVMLFLAMAASAGSLLLSSRLHRGYVGALGESLRTGVLQMAPGAASDGTTRKTLSGTAESIDRAALLAEIDALRRTGAPTLDPLRASTGLAALDPLVQALVDLTSREPPRVRRVLAAAVPDPRLTAHILPLLDEALFHREAAAALRVIAPRIVGQLVDALLAATWSPEVRRRVAKLLRAVPNERALAGLLAGLDDASFGVRYECGLSLLRITEKNPALRVPTAPIHEAVQRELERGRGAWQSAVLDAPEEEDDDAPRSLRGSQERTDRSLEHVFSLLALVLDRDPLRIAYQVLDRHDEALRGTALEYLENVLPEPIRDAIWPFIGEKKPAPRLGPRLREEVAKELLRSAASLPLLALPEDSPRGPRR